MDAPRTLDRLFGIDLRSLAAVRIGTALILLYDLIRRAGDLTDHYTDAGVLPREAILGGTSAWWKLTPHLLGGSRAYQAALFLIAGMFGVALLIGYRTTLATVISWTLLVSLHQRNPLVLFGGDDVLKVLLLWGMFVPWGRWGSVDRRSAPHSWPDAMRVTTGGTAALLLQIALIYLVTALLKTGSEWRRDLSAIYYGLSIDTFVGPLGPDLYRFPGCMRALTWATFWIELCSPVLLFSPVLTRPLRWMAVAGLAGLHVGIALTMHVYFFPFINLVSLLAFVPTETWDRLGRRFRFARGALARPGAPDPADVWFEKVRGRAALVLIAYVALLNARVPEWARRPGEIFSLEQHWNMFAPRPYSDDGWFVVAGTLGDGRRVDLLRGGATLTMRKPDDPWAGYGNERWRKYYRRMWQRRARGLYASFGPWACARWKRDHPDEPLTSVEPIYMLEPTEPDYRRPAVRPVPLGPFACAPEN